MTVRPDSRARARTRTGIRTTRRLSPCYRHPDEPLTGICASCLRERLSGLDASSTTTTSFTAVAPELRRCRSVLSVSKCEASSSTSLKEPRRKSCDVISGERSLSNLFDADDVKIGSEFDSDVKVESKHLGLSRVTYTVIEPEDENLDEIRVSSKKLGELDVECVDSDGEVEEGESKTMKEYIDLEFQNKNKKSKDLREIAGNFWGAASVFSKKLRKWKIKNNSDKMKKLNNGSHGKIIVGGDGDLQLFENGGKLEGNHSEIVGRRRSCDTDPKFSVDGGRISFEEPRASWDGYMIARSIPRLAPMFSVVENGILGNMNKFESHRLSVDGPMHSIIEDESSSSGVSANSNSDSSSSMMRSSFDHSSSVRSFGKKVIGSEDHGVSPGNVKLVITEKELKDWHLSSSRGEGLEKIGSFSKDNSPNNVGNLNAPPKKSVRWSRVYNVFGFKPKNSENKCDTFGGNVTDDISEKQVEEAGGLVKDFTDWKLTRSSSVVGSRKSCDAIVSDYRRRRSVDNAGGWTLKGREDFTRERNRSSNYSSTDFEDGVKPFYMTPLRSLRRSKSGKLKLQNSHSMARSILQLN